MRLLEFQAKRLLTAYGLEVPQGTLLNGTSDGSMLELPVVLKAQVTVGGRGKAGAVRVIRERQEIAPTLSALRGMVIKDQPVMAVLAEALVEIQKEYYLAVLIDKKEHLPLVIASGAGGVDIEEVARTEANKIVRQHIDPEIDLQDFQVRTIARGMGLAQWTGLKGILNAMLALLYKEDATLVEINPLAETKGGLVALDAKIVLDDKAAFRHGERFEQLRGEQENLRPASLIQSEAERLAALYQITFVPLGGDIGLITDGAGTGMLVIDLLNDLGGRPADFCELGGLGNAEKMRQAIAVILAQPGVKVLLISLIGGMTRMDDMANGIVAYLAEKNLPVPLVVRMCGTQEEAGKATLKEAGVLTYDDILEAAQQAIALSKKEQA